MFFQYIILIDLSVQRLKIITLTHSDVIDFLDVKAKTSKCFYTIFYHICLIYGHRFNCDKKRASNNNILYLNQITTSVY